MMDDHDALSAVGQNRAPQTVGAVIHVKERCASTQDEARAHAENGAAHGTVVVAQHQENGRGRRGRSWTMLDGALAFSVVIRPNIAIDHAPRIPLLVGVALFRAAKSLGNDVALKWPNDVLVVAHPAGPLGNFRKIAGILVEASVVGGALSHVIVGVGMNIGPLDAHRALPDDIARIAGAMDATAVDGQRAGVLAVVLDALDEVLGDPDAAFPAALETARAHCATLGRRIDVPEEGISGRGLDIDDDGALLVIDDEGETHRIIAGDVFFQPTNARAL